MTHKIEGPFPLTIKATANGAELDVTRFLRAVFLDLFDAADADPQGFGEELAEMAGLSVSAQHGGADSHARHEFNERMNRLIERLASDGKFPLYAGGVRQLAAAAREIAAPRPVPGQREAGAA